MVYSFSTWALPLCLGSISHKFSIWKFLLISKHETTASYGQFGISFSISSRPRNMLYHLDYSHVLAIYSSCLWWLTAQQGKTVFWKLWEFNYQLCSHGLSSKVLGLIKGNVTFGSVHCHRAKAKSKRQNKTEQENKKSAFFMTHLCSFLAILHLAICSHLFSLIVRSEIVCMYVSVRICACVLRNSYVELPNI